MSQSTNETASQENKEGIGGFIGNLVLSMLFPIWALWYGPKYLIKGEYVKGILLIVIVAVEFIVVLSIMDVI
jgi:hypothetical protein